MQNSFPAGGGASPIDRQNRVMAQLAPWRLAQQSLGGCQRSTTIYSVDIWDRQGSRSGATVTRTTRRRCWWWWWRMTCGKKWRVKLIFQGTYRLSGTGIVECLKIIDVRYNLKQFDAEADRNAFFIFGRTKTKFHFRPKNENESHLCLYHRS